ncbi:unnamed protein product [Paramecium pentaurelia]|uniref:Transmembrane protein n=1 Tax=Paramecium pentaurelia TaxID=43138 RepID=A0A8S1URD3_9CILI|nr:unnamed protein product [Paramecium pentaurelia]
MYQFQLYNGLCLGKPFTFVQVNFCVQCNNLCEHFDGSSKYNFLSCSSITLQKHLKNLCLCWPGYFDYKLNLSYLSICGDQTQLLNKILMMVKMIHLRNIINVNLQVKMNVNLFQRQMLSKQRELLINQGYYQLHINFYWQQKMNNEMMIIFLMDIIFFNLNIIIFVFIEIKGFDIYMMKKMVGIQKELNVNLYVKMEQLLKKKNNALIQIYIL